MESRPHVRGSQAPWEPAGRGGGGGGGVGSGSRLPLFLPPWLPVCLAASLCRDQAPLVAGRTPLHGAAHPASMAGPHQVTPPPGLRAHVRGHEVRLPGQRPPPAR